MEPTDSAQRQKTCFVVMGFGVKTDYENNNRSLDLDASYLGMIKPAVEEAGLRCIRADDIHHSGTIDLYMYELLLSADVVVADISTSNKNAFYELGVRHALRPSSTIIISAKPTTATAYPFDINHTAIQQYEHLGADIGNREAKRFKEVLTGLIKEILAKDPVAHDSPVYTFLHNLTPPALKALQEEGLKSFAAVDSIIQKADGADKPRYSEQMDKVREAQKQGNWFKMQTLLEIIRDSQAEARAKARQAASVQVDQDAPEDPHILQQLALATYKSKQPTEQEALLAARGLLELLNPHTTNDTQTLGMWGSVNKRLWNLAKRTAAPTEPQPKSANFLDEAIRANKRGYYMGNDYYNGISLALLLNMRAAEPTAPVAEAIADYVLAQRTRKEVVDICDQWLAARATAPASTDDDPLAEPEQQREAAERYWVMANQAEAYLGLGQDEKANQLLQQAYALAPEAWMKTTTDEQLDQLRELLAVNPLQHIAPAS